MQLLHSGSTALFSPMQIVGFLMRWFILLMISFTPFQTATAIVSPTIRTIEHIEENETAPPRETANVLNEAKQQETVSTNNEVIQRSDADQSDRSVIQMSDVNTVMAEDESHVERTSRESESLHTDNISHEAVPEPEMQTETVCTPVVEDRTRRTVCFSVARLYSYSYNLVNYVELCYRLYKLFPVFGLHFDCLVLTTSACKSVSSCYIQRNNFRLDILKTL